MSMRKALHQEPTGTMYDEQERQKALRLQRETHEPQEPRLEWIYTGDKSKSEDYLLGKKYDSEVQSNPLPEDNSITTSTIDLANKIREDPLYLIKKREIEQKKNILDNPVRLKQLKELLERKEAGQSSSHKKRRHSRSRSRSPPPRHHHQQQQHRGHHRSPPPPRHRRRSRSPSPRRHRPSPPPRSAPAPRRERTPPRQNKPSKEERDRRIREMLADGAVRTEQRQQNVRSYKARDDQEEKVNEVLKQRARKRNEDSSSEDEEHDFIQPMMKQVVNDPSLKRRDLKHHHHKRR